MKLMYFSAEYCGACKATKPKVEKVAKDMNIELQVIDPNENLALCNQMMVRSLPVLLIIGKERDVVGRLDGAQTEESIIEEINNCKRILKIN